MWNEMSITNLLLQSARLGNRSARLRESNLSLEPRLLPHAKQPESTDKRKRLYHQSSIDANSPIKHRQNVTENPILSLCPVISSCATYLRQSRYYTTITTTASTLPRPDSIPCRDPDPSHRREGRDPLTINPSHVHRPVVAGRPPIIRSTEI
jgi:hypothetical protein